jgi:hypothetical protein
MRIARKLFILHSTRVRIIDDKEHRCQI